MTANESTIQSRLAGSRRGSEASLAAQRPIRPARMTDATKLLNSLRLLDIGQDAERMRRGEEPLPKTLSPDLPLPEGYLGRTA